MACRGVLFAITKNHAQKLRAARGDDAAVLSIVQDEIEQAWDEAHLCQHLCVAETTLKLSTSRKSGGLADLRKEAAFACPLSSSPALVIWQIT